jgi:hypothetical protein
MQLSFALSQKFIELSQGKRPVTVDCNVLGMGRGAGNTPTELILNYMNSKYEYLNIYYVSLLEKSAFPNLLKKSFFSFHSGFSGYCF